MSNPTVDVRTILSAEALKDYQANYSLEVMLGAARYSLNTPFPPASPWANFITEEMYSEEFIEATLRETLVISSLIQQGSVGPLKVHFYWGMMSGLTVQQIAAIITLTGTYSGVDKYTTSIRLFSDVLYFMRDWQAAGNPLDSKTVGLAMLNSSNQ